MTAWAGIVARQEALGHEPIDHARRGRGGDPESSRELRHPELTGRQDEVQGFRLGHRQVDEVELWSVACHQLVHQAVEHREDPIKLGIVGTRAPGRFG